MLNNDRQIKISAAGSRRAAQWPAQELWLSELYERLRTPARGTETMADYLSMPKRRQDDLKDVGGFVGGVLHGGLRKAGCVAARDLITLDMDHVAAGGTGDVLKRLAALGCGYAVYSTRKHRPDAPRLRAVIPCDRSLTADEYEPAARRVAQLLDPSMQLFDRTTFEPARLMYWPSCCSDSQYVFDCADKPLLSADQLLALYDDWRDVSSWPAAADAQKNAAHTAARQEDPTTKRGVIGAFCRCYDVPSAMDTFLPGIYAPADAPDRYTFTGGSTTGGAIVYDGGRYLYSHHATDPAGGQLCNAFDLVRLHRFGAADDDSKPDTPVNKLPSYTAMRRLAVADGRVAALLDREHYDAATKAFRDTADTADAAPAAPAESTEWMRKLRRNPNNGAVDRTADNIILILRNDPLLRGRIALDTFANRGIAFGPYPWDDREDRRVWGDNDDAGMRWYLEKVYDLTGKDKIFDAISLCGRENAHDPVCDYLNGLTWDGVPRLDRLFVDYLGAADTPYTHAVTRKALCAAVARAMIPGIKFDNMTILSGAQGIGKSMLLSKLGRRWFSDSMKTFEGKEACELVQGVWIIEIGELEAMSRSEVGRVKQFLSQSNDIFRVPYGKRTELYPRRCVFFGTSNNREYLRDDTGGRRFWPVDVGMAHRLTVWDDLTDETVDQIWAEAFTAWRLGESLILTGELDSAARQEQESHRERSPLEGRILEWLEQPIPSDWSSWELQRRQMFWSGSYVARENDVLVARGRVCAQEVWAELFGMREGTMKRSDAREINGVLAAMPGWESSKGAVKFGFYGKQRGFIRAATLTATKCGNIGNIEF